MSKEKKKCYMFKYRGSSSAVWHCSKVYVSFHQCKQGAKDFVKFGAEVDFYEADLNWDYIGCGVDL